jgi:DNA helicase II / ATP-dependent DNA helicase PcrA
MTRARDLLVVSAAYWYEGPSEPYASGTFYQEVADRPESDVLPPDPVPEENPLIEFRRRRVGTWPPAARTTDVDDLFPEGWHRVAAEAVRDPATAAARAADLGPGVQASFERALAQDTERAARITSRTRPQAVASPPEAISVTGLIDYEGCPRHFYWSQVRPLPRRPNPAARLGSEIHQWIERESRGQAMLDLDDLPDLSPDEHLAEPGAEAALKEAFRNSRFAGVPALYVERPFALFLDGVVVRGKIDAIFGTPDGHWEVVDYKTGRVPSADDPLLGLQLDLYALACTEVWHKRPDDLTLTYLYLATGEEVAVPAGDPSATRRRVLSVLSAIAEGRFDPRPGPRCRWCDFRAFCPEGEEYVREHPDS